MDVFLGHVRFAGCVMWKTKEETILTLFFLVMFGFTTLTVWLSVFSFPVQRPRLFPSSKRRSALVLCMKVCGCCRVWVPWCHPGVNWDESPVFCGQEWVISSLSNHVTYACHYLGLSRWVDVWDMGSYRSPCPLSDPVPEEIAWFRLNKNPIVGLVCEMYRLWNVQEYVNGNSRILKWRYCTIKWRYVPLHRPYIW